MTGIADLVSVFGEIHCVSFGSILTPVLRASPPSPSELLATELYLFPLPHS